MKTTSTEAPLNNAQKDIPLNLEARYLTTILNRDKSSQNTEETSSVTISHAKKRKLACISEDSERKKQQRLHPETVLFTVPSPLVESLSYKPTWFSLVMGTLRALVDEQWYSRCFLYGGAIRDLLLHRLPSDVDVYVMDEETRSLLVKRLKQCGILQSEKIGGSGHWSDAYMILFPGQSEPLKLDLCIHRQEETDFTCNNLTLTLTGEMKTRNPCPWNRSKMECLWMAECMEAVYRKELVCMSGLTEDSFENQLTMYKRRCKMNNRGFYYRRMTNGDSFERYFSDLLIHPMINKWPKEMEQKPECHRCTKVIEEEEYLKTTCCGYISHVLCYHSGFHSGRCISSL